MSTVSAANPNGAPAPVEPLSPETQRTQSNPWNANPRNPRHPRNPFEPVQVFASQADALSALKAEIGPQCTRCKLHTLGRRQVVFGVGNPNADLMFVGEGPGADEDIQGEPFVGRAGQLLTKIIEAIGMTRGDVYIANVIKCRPPQNRNPEPDEVEQCEPFLFRQIETIKPKVIVALGKFAAQSLLKTTEPITRIRGREYKLPRRDPDADVSPGVSAPQPFVEARGLGGHEESPRDTDAGCGRVIQNAECRMQN